MAKEVFKHDVLRIHLSDLDQTFREHTLGIWEGFCMVGVFVIITNDEDLTRDSFRHMLKLMNFMTRGR